MKKYFLLLLSIAFLSSCVPSRNLIYLQGEPIQEKGIKRINNIPYKLQVDDILNNFRVKRVVIGHTKDNNIRSLYNDKVMAIDMYHVDNFNNGYMEGLQFELGCFYLFHTDGINNNYNLIGNCDSLTSNLILFLISEYF